MMRRRRRQRRKWRLFFRLILVSLTFICLASLALLSYIKTLGPPPLQVQQATVYYSNDNKVIGERSNGERRYSVALSNIAQPVIDATLAVEDRRFYEHFGFDLRRIGGAIIANIKSSGRSQGASTITQQYARNLYLTHEKTWERKWKELIYALRLEFHYEKDELLEGYLNTVYYGHGAYGIEAAANYFFNKKASELSLAEASMLAGIPKGPSYYSPFNDYERAKSRQALILQAMVQDERITEADAKRAQSETLHFTKTKQAQPKAVGPYFQEAAEQFLINEAKIDEATLKEGGLKVYTTLDRQLQQLADAEVAKRMPDSQIQVALTVQNPKNGDVLALIGGRNYEESEYNRATRGKRAPGSAFKPLLYYAALEHGFTASSTLLSEESAFPYDDGRAIYEPSNYKDVYANDFITMMQALAFSDNVYAVKTHLLLGMDRLIETARRVGISSELSELPSLALGTMPVHLLELTSAYSTFANEGKATTPTFVRKVIGKDGEVLFEANKKTTQVLDQRVAFILTDLMTAMFDRSLNAHISVTGNSIADFLDRPVAGKSGTTSTDSWMIGYTPQLVTGVWIGYDEGKRLNEQTEGQLAKQIWASFMREAHRGKAIETFQPPAGVVESYIEPSSGLLATAQCTNARKAYFIKGTEPTKVCTAEKEQSDDHHDDEPLEEERERLLKKFFKWLRRSDDSA